MELTTMQLVGVFIVSALAGMSSILDEFEFHQPILSCALMGLVLGDLKTGIILGGTLELIVLGWMNIGAAVAPDAALAGTISAILVLAGHQSIGTGIAIAIPIAAAGQVLTIFIRTITVFFQHKADDFAQKGSCVGIDACHLIALSLQALRVAIPSLLVAMYAGTAIVQSMLDAIPPVITGGLQAAGGFIVVVGYAMVINMMDVSYLMPFFFLGFVVAAFTTFNLVAFGVIGLVLAIIYIQLSPKYNKPTVVQAAPSSAKDDDLDDELDD